MNPLKHNNMFEKTKQNWKFSVEFKHLCDISHILIIYGCSELSSSGGALHGIAEAMGQIL